MSAQIQVDLEGLLPLGEKRKLLNKFIAHAKENEVNNILKDCERLPSAQYNLLKLLLADKFHRFDLIIELLYEGDSAILNGAVSKRWLYQEDSLLTDEFLLNTLFPNVSYNCRQKLLHRLGRYVKNEERADKIWNAVEQRYGFNIAFPLFQACSKDKINSVITSRKVDLSGYQLVEILKKYPEIGLDYLKNHCGGFYSSKNSYRSPVYFLYKNRPDDFLDLCINHSDKIHSFKFGRSRSTKLIRTYRAKLLEKPNKFSPILKLDRIRREFSIEEFQTMFHSSLAKDINDIHHFDMWRWVDTVPIDMRIKMVNEAYMKLFQIDLNENLEFVKPEYIILLPVERRLSVIQWKIEEESDHNGWTYKGLYVHYNYNSEEKKRAFSLLKPISHSVPELEKSLLIEQDLNKRATLSKYLIETCYINEDLPQLLNVLRLLNKRSRNDQGEVRNEIFATIVNIMQKMEFSKEHWDIIIEMIQVSIAFKEKRDRSDVEKEKIVEKCIAFHLESKLSLNNLVSTHIKLRIQISSHCWTNSYIKNPADRRTLLESYVKELENLELADNLCSYKGKTLESEELTGFIVNLIEEICKFNKSSQDIEPIRISSHEWLKNNFERIVKEEEKRVNKNCSTPDTDYCWDFAKQLISMLQILRKEENLCSNAFNSLEDLFSKILNCSPTTSILIYFFHKNPSVLKQNWSEILTKVLRNKSTKEFMTTKCMRKLKSSGFSTLVAESIKICSDMIDSKDYKVKVHQKCNAIHVLSVLSEASDFLSLVAKFYPLETQINPSLKHFDDHYDIAEAFAKSLVNVSVAHLTFPAIENFAVGDYLKNVIGSLNSQTGRASETKSLDFLRQKVLKTPVSLQKHIIRQYFTIGYVKEKIRILNEIDSRNVSIRHEVFRQANKLFISSPSKETWFILKTIMEKTTLDDAATVTYLYTARKLHTYPLEYLSDYIQACLAVLRNAGADTFQHFINLLGQIMEKLPEATLDDIILYKNENQVSFSSTFCHKYLKSSSSTSVLEHRLLNLWSLFEKIIENGWDRQTRTLYFTRSFDYPTRSLIFSFISKLCLEKLNDDSSKAWLPHQIFETLVAKFKALSTTKFFKEIVYLELALLSVKEAEKEGIEKLRPFGRSLAQFTDSLVEKNGGEIVCMLNETVQKYVENCFSIEINNNKGVIVELIGGILETSKTRHNQIIAINFLQNANPKSSNLIATKKHVSEILKESDDVVVQMYYGYVNH